MAFNYHEVSSALDEYFLTSDDTSLRITVACLLFQGRKKYPIKMHASLLKNSYKVYKPLFEWACFEVLNKNLQKFFEKWLMEEFSFPEPMKGHLVFTRHDIKIEVEMLGREDGAWSIQVLISHPDIAHRAMLTKEHLDAMAKILTP